jgi:xylulokinase
MALLLGLDVGSSSIKATLLDSETGGVVASATSPKTELEITATQPGWAEQHPEVWWDHVKATITEIRAQAKIDVADVKAIGISYQMHGLVLVDEQKQVLRPSIIWCDSRAVEIGDRAFRKLGQKTCLKHLLNSPGNFTASKLKWVMENEPDVYARVHKAMLPGDYVAFRMTDEIVTTPSGLSEGILWDFPADGLAELVLEHYGISSELIPRVVPTFSVQGELTKNAADELGLKPGTPIAYRGGDQPNNALSLKVLHPGEIAATAGTSGVVYGVTRETNYDPQSRVNTFVHVNHAQDNPSYGVLLCINGTGILNSWLKHQVMTVDGHGVDYGEMNARAAQAPVGSDGLVILPYGNGAERTLGNRNIGASIHGLNFNIHKPPHYLRAAQEGIVFAFNYGLEIMREIGVDVATVRAGDANMFLSPLFGTAFATLTGARVELYNTDGSQGAARGAGIGAGIYKSLDDGFAGLQTTKVIEPDAGLQPAYKEAYGKWRDVLELTLSGEK